MKHNAQNLRAKRTARHTRAVRSTVNTTGGRRRPPLFVRLPSCPICRKDTQYIYCTRGILRYTKCRSCGHLDKIAIADLPVEP